MRFAGFISLIFILVPACVVAGVSDADLKKVADKIGERVPVMVDANTQLTGVTGGNNMLTYRYKLVKYKASDMNREKFGELQKKNVIRNSCTKIMPILKAEVTVVYDYVGKDEKPISSFRVSLKDCK